MQRWLTEAWDLVQAALGRPAGLELGVSLALAAVLFVAALVAVSKAMGFSRNGLGAAVAVLAVSLIAILAGLVALRWYVLPAVSSSWLAAALPAATILVLMLAVAVPLQCGIQKAGYLPALLALAIAVGVAAGGVLMFHHGYGAFRQGSATVDKVRIRNDRLLPE
jgi:uncharacterized membrane protein